MQTCLAQLRQETDAFAACKDMAPAHSSDPIWSSASSSSSSLSNDSSFSDVEKGQHVNKNVSDSACLTTTSARDAPQLPVVSASHSTTHIIVTNSSDTVLPAPVLARPGSSPPTLPSEIILYMFKFLATAHDLRSAVLVCKLWCSCGMDLLWSKPSLMTLSVAEKMIHTIDQSEAFFPYAHYIRRLNLSFLSQELTDSVLTRFAECSRLERLLLPGSLQTTATGLKQILSRGSGLYSLDLSDIPAVTDEVIEHVAAECRRLHTLYLGSCTDITDNSIVKLAESCTHLKRIKLSLCTHLTDRSILALTQNCPQLIEIDVTNCNQVTDVAVQAIFDNLPQIRDINLTLLTEITNAAFSTIRSTTHRFEQLRVLNLTSCALITDETLARIIPAAPRLRNLALTNKITDRFIATLAQHCTRIRYLDLACCSKLTDAAVFALAQLPKLRRIGLVKCSNITDHGIYAILVSHILHQTLERVHLSYCVHLSDTAVAALVSQCSKLTHLSLTGVPAFIAPQYQKFCRAPPPEFTPHQREVFCVFSGKGVRELRQHMQENELAMSSAANNMASIIANYRIMTSTVASMVAATETAAVAAAAAAGVAALGSSPMPSAPPSASAAFTAATLLAQIGTDILATTADATLLGDALPSTTEAQGVSQIHLMSATEAVATSPEQAENVEDVTMAVVSTEELPEFPPLQHPHHQHAHHYLEHRDAGVHGVDMELDSAVETGCGGDDLELSRIPSPGALARSLDREGEGSGAGSASPGEDEEADDDDDDDDF
ncbi:SCF ubiquitin ligase complex subunit [Mortierella alpina]|uniref:SCF ubiquitin ligase complex subunit n=1 Tax=Mortierella alpina TaxID=64518 RepID=A0A9P6M193_MORAP|nr:SCF ubiquitin ligase complex subunit [Mortierella alpina]